MSATFDPYARDIMSYRDPYYYADPFAMGGDDFGYEPRLPPRRPMPTHRYSMGGMGPPPPPPPRDALTRFHSGPYGYEPGYYYGRMGPEYMRDASPDKIGIPLVPSPGEERLAKLEALMMETRNEQMLKQERKLRDKDLAARKKLEEEEYTQIKELAALKDMIKKQNEEAVAREKKHKEEDASVAAKWAREKEQMAAAERWKKEMKDAEDKAKKAAEEEAAKKAAKTKEEADKELAELKKKHKEAEDEKKKFEEEAKALKPKAPPAPIKFKDAVGRKFSFPFDICKTWKARSLLQI